VQSLPNADNLHWPSDGIKYALHVWNYATYGDALTAILPNPELAERLGEFLRILSRFIPDDLGYQSLEFTFPSIGVDTNAGRFPIDTLSAGLGGLARLLWDLYTSELLDRPSIVLIDEVELHLHPSLQRIVLPRLLESLPSYQFVVSTHAPLVVGSVQDSAVYALRRNERHLIESVKLNFEERAGTANEILREVLGVPMPAPVWVEEKMKSLASQYESVELTSETFQAIRAELETIGLADFVPETLAEVIAANSSKT
jgi:hypothetical protein